MAAQPGDGTPGGNGFNMSGMKRQGLLDASGKDIYADIKGKKAKAYDQEGERKLKEAQDLAVEISADYVKRPVQDDKPYVGAQPKLLRKPEIATEAQSARATQVAVRTLQAKIASVKGVHVVCAQDSLYSNVVKQILESAVDDGIEGQENDADVIVSLGNDWLQTLPFTKRPSLPHTGDRLRVYLGTPGRYLAMCIRSARGGFENAYVENRAVALCKGVCMMPLGSQQQNVFGIEECEVLKAIASACWARGKVVWGHGAGSKASIMGKAYGYPEGGPLPPPLAFDGDAGGSMVHFDYFTEYIKYLNLVKLSKPTVAVTNYYDTGLLVSVLTGSVVERGPSLLMDRDGVAILRDASIGHIISKLNQLIAVEPYASTRGVYNFFIGDGACRLNGGVELALHLIEGYKAKSLITLFVYNNYKWAIEDNLVAETEKEHVLYNKSFYDLLEQHGSVCICNNDLELRETLAFLSRRTGEYLQGKAQPGLSLVIVRGIDIALPPVLGDIEPVLQSSEMKFMRDVLGPYAEGCQHKVPIYGCSAFEYIQYLHLFLEKMPEGKKYQYVCGRTDIQAAHMCGFQQPEGKCVLMINDVYGINSLGESLRFVLSGFGGKQLLIMIWHPSLIKMIDNFHLHRPPMVWPSVGPELCKYYVRKESDALFVDFEGSASAVEVTAQVNEALKVGTPLVVVNVLPEQERDFVSLDIRVKTG